MLAVLEFCFSSFTVYCGCTVWLALTLTAICVAAEAFQPLKR
jgi:hypothetical protein